LSSSSFGTRGSPKFDKIGLGEMDGEIASAEANVLDPEDGESRNESGRVSRFLVATSLC
jgi:hypothetical protein